MLEGQVAVLSSGLPSPSEAAELVEAMFESPLYRADQQSFLLYPERPVVAFLDRGHIAPERVASNPLLAALAEAGDRTLIVRDADGEYRFAPTFRKDDHVREALTRLQSNRRYAALVDAHGASVLQTYESVFHHSSFTGRSGSMFGYEGIGCIYWHMVAKLMLATQESYLHARDMGETASAKRLKALYYRVRSGLGFHKSAAVYGAFPPDPYSHTPKHAGAQQPGMTGQVKEELLTRLSELGVTVRDGSLSFDTDLLQPSEVCISQSTFRYVDVAGKEIALPLPPNSLAFTFCQTPVIYTFGSPARLDVRYTDGTTETLKAAHLPASLAAQIFERKGAIHCLHLFVARQPAE